MEPLSILHSYNLTIDSLVDWIKDRGVTPLLLGITGSHMWNTAGPESDIDIRGLYLAPTSRALSLYPGNDTIEANKILGDKVDIQLYEVAKAFKMLLNGNGNLVELLLSPTIIYQSDNIYRWIAEQFLTRDLSRYYLGYFTSQRHRAGQNRGSKALVYAYRELAAGTWLMEHNKIIYDFWELRNLYEKEHGHSALLEEFLAQENWNTPQTDDRLGMFEAEWEKMTEIFKAARDVSTLPKDYNPATREALDKMLFNIRVVDLRREGLV